MASFVQMVCNSAQNTSPTTFTTVTVPIAAAPALGNTLIGIARIGSSNTITTANDSQNNPWRIDLVGTGNGGPNTAVLSCWPKNPLTSSDTLTLKLFSTSTNSCVLIGEYAGAWLYNDLAVGIQTGSGGGPRTVTSTKATGQAKELVVTGIGWGISEDPGVSITGGSGFTLRAQGSTGADYAAFADLDAAATLTPSVIWSYPTTTSSYAVFGSYVRISPAGFAPWFAEVPR